MWPLKRRKSKAPPASTCYFCSAVQSQLSPSSGSVHRFICSSCGSYNAIQPDGFSPIDNDRPALHFDSSLPANARSLSHKAVSTTHMTSIMTADRLYCSTCRQHQSLQTYLLASYFDNVQEGSDEDRLLRERLPEYRASLQERYPLLCPTCQPDVLEELKKRNSCARASILNQYMIRSRPDSPSLSEKKFEGRHQRKGRRDKRATLRWRLQGLAWMLKGLIWGVLQLMTLLCALKGAALYSRSTVKHATETQLRCTPTLDVTTCFIPHFFYISISLHRRLVSLQLLAAPMESISPNSCCFARSQTRPHQRKTVLDQRMPHDICLAAGSASLASFPQQSRHSPNDLSGDCASLLCFYHSRISATRHCDRGV